MKGTFEATEYLSKLNEKDPFRKWLEEQRSKIKDKLYLEVISLGMFKNRIFWTEFENILVR